MSTPAAAAVEVIARLTVALSTVLLAACASVPQLLEDSRHERAYALALKRVERRVARAKPPRPAQLIEYLRAFDAVQIRDLEAVWRLEVDPGGAKYDPLFRRYEALYARSEDILMVSPEAAPFELLPELYPAELERRREHARHRAAVHYDSLGAPARARARLGDKLAARRAYRLHDSVAYFSPKRARLLRPSRDSLAEVATLRIHVFAVGDDGDAEIQSALDGYREPARRGWTELTSAPAGRRIDLAAEVRYLNASASGPDESCSSRDYEKEVLDRVERKRVEVEVNDSTTVWKTVEVEHFKSIYATVVTCHQSASAHATGEVAVYTAEADQLTWREPVRATATWSDGYAYTEGDRRAVPGIAPSGRPNCAPSRATLLSRARTRLGHAAWRSVMREYGE